MEITTIDLDVAKGVFKVHGADAAGKGQLRRKVPRANVLTFFASLPPCLLRIEACDTAHRWAREIQSSVKYTASYFTERIGVRCSAASGRAYCHDRSARFGKLEGNAPDQSA